MTASDTARQHRRGVGLTIGLLMVATVFLAIASAAIGEEILTLPESRQEAADIAARLPGLRAERDSLIEENAKLRAEISSQKTKIEQADAILRELPRLQDEEAQARAERDRLAKEVISLTSDQDTLQGTVDSLAGRRKSFEDAIDNLASRAEAERKRLDEVRQAVDEERKTLAQTTDALSAARQNLAQSETALANTDRLLDSKRAELTGLTAEAQGIRDQVMRLRDLRDELTTGNQRVEERIANLQSDIATARTALAAVEGERDRARETLARTEARLETENAWAEATSARLQRLTGLEAKVRQQIRTMIEELGEVERTQGGSETSQ